MSRQSILVIASLRQKRNGLVIAIVSGSKKLRWSSIAKTLAVTFVRAFQTPSTKHRKSNVLSTLFETRFANLSKVKRTGANFNREETKTSGVKFQQSNSGCVFAPTCLILLDPYCTTKIDSSFPKISQHITERMRSAWERLKRKWRASYKLLT